jgi:hypothetical protein
LSSTEVTAAEAVTDAATDTFPVRVAPLAGEVMLTVGPGTTLLIVMDICWLALLPPPSVAVASSVCCPLL